MDQSQNYSLTASLKSQTCIFLALFAKRFVYSGDCQKVIKHVEFSVDLEISRDLLSAVTKSKYKLVTFPQAHSTSYIQFYMRGDTMVGVEKTEGCDKRDFKVNYPAFATKVPNLSRALNNLYHSDSSLS